MSKSMEVTNGMMCIKKHKEFRVAKASSVGQGVVDKA